MELPDCDCSLKQMSAFNCCFSAVSNGFFANFDSVNPVRSRETSPERAQVVKQS